MMLRDFKSYLSLQAAFILVVGILTSGAQAQTLEFKADKWQLISFSRLPKNSSISDLFGAEANNGGGLKSVWTFDNNAKQWQSWPAQPNVASSDLDAFEVGKGYWVKTTKDITLDLANATESVGEMVLYPGWNLVGFTMEQSLTHEQALAGVPYLELWSFVSNQSKFLAVQKSHGSQIILKEEFTQVEPNRGYWVYMAEQSTLQPKMGTLLPPDIDIEPLLNLTEYGKETEWTEQTPGDIDWDGDGYFDFPNTQSVVAFGDFLNRQRVSITNDGNGVLAWQATIEPAVDWLLFEAFDEDEQPVLTNFAIGNVSNTQGELILVANRTGMAPSDNYKTQIVLRANGSVQEKRIDVSLAVADVVGDYEMVVRLDDVDGKKADLHNPKYFLSFARDGQGVKAFLDEERSLLIPEITYLSGDYIADPESHFQVLGQLYFPKEHDHNPYENDIRREFTIVGQRSDGKDGLSPLDLKGTYSENIYGIFDQPVQLKGEFVARRLSPIPKKKDQSITRSSGGELLASETTTFELDVKDRYSITDIKTALSIEHPEPEQLTLTLKGPQWFDNEGNSKRTTVVLHDRQARVLGDVRFDDYDPSIDSMDSYDGQLSFGRWTLEVLNRSTSIGKLNSWALDVSGAKVYKLTGQIEDAGITIQISGCGFVKRVVTNAQGYFEFDGLIPCDYELKVLQLGYEITTTDVRITGCSVNPALNKNCDTEAEYIQALEASELGQLQPQLIASSGAMKVIAAPAAGQLPVTLQAVDVTDYSQLGKTLVSREWELYKRVNSWSAISPQGYLIDVEASGNQVPPGSNYISYSEDIDKWNPSARLTIESTGIVDPRGGYSAAKLSHDGTGMASVITSSGMGDGTFEVKKDEFVTLSVFLKEGTNDEIRFRFADGSTFLDAEVLNFKTGAHTGGTDLVSSTQSLANGWYRAAVTYKVPQDTTNFHCDLWYAAGGTYDVKTPSDMYMFGPQCEKHSTEEPLVPISVDGVVVFVPQHNMTGYMATGANHVTRSALAQQDVLIKTATTGKSASWSYDLADRRELAGVYYLKLKSTVQGTSTPLTYTTNLMSISKLQSGSGIYLGAFGVHGAAGTTSLKAMDTATFDIDRFPLMSDSGSQGMEDSDGFKSQDIEGDEYETNAPNDTQDNAPYAMTPTGMDAPSGNMNKHYRMYISAGQLYQGGSMYGGNFRLDAGLQSQQSQEEAK